MPDKNRFETIGGDELYRKLAMGESVVVLDVRAEAEYERRHIPGSKLIPLPSLDERIEELVSGDVPIAVVCEQGVRSVNACRLLAEHGIGPLMTLEGGLRAWPGPARSGIEPNGRHRHGVAPSAFLVEHFHKLPQGLALDLAMGEGRNAVYLSTRGFDVDGVDSDPRKVARARAAARKLGAPIRAVVGNVEDGTYIIPIETYNVIVVFNFLFRPLFRDIREGLLPGGVVVYQTFTTQQATLGRPKNPDYLLRPGELKSEFVDWEILAYRELVGPARDGRGNRAVAGMIARKPETHD